MKTGAVLFSLLVLLASCSPSTEAPQDTSTSTSSTVVSTATGEASASTQVKPDGVNVTEMTGVTSTTGAATLPAMSASGTLSGSAMSASGSAMSVSGSAMTVTNVPPASVSGSAVASTTGATSAQ